MAAVPGAQMQGSGDHAQTVANHYNRLEESGLEQRSRSRIFYLRNFNNWIKSVLIARTLEKLRAKDPQKTVSVLDLCSGKGGDLLKWKKGNIDYLVCADIAATSVEQSESRYKENLQRENNRLYGAEFIVADCTKDRLKEKYRHRGQSFDLVSCHFSFHYCFESYAQALVMLRNVSECLRVGGYFIGTTPNSNELVRRLRNSKGNTFGNEVYSITFPQEDKTNFPLFGAMYNFNLEGVVDCPEFLVYFPVLERLAARFGLKLIKKQAFAEYFKDNVGHRESLTLLSAMQALEPFPSVEGTEPMSNKAEDYKFAQELLSSLSESQSHDQRRPPRIGTLSQAEWDAATIYLIFVFEKVEDVSLASIPVAGAKSSDEASNVNRQGGGDGSST
ncbi:mRNA cap guanine-n7 methyltransferase-like [Plakobranchus ocellatus]|uniref:mRNA cap guanine-N(7) methyltransferase n=1 Tax=Plakobranchus ocellatus TaxID=259542 RepID=A0AAV3Y9V1_9GAST|nr:mRNA cap guanine-n7 methyltransferase-like [Plakobranchus ocellatus]